MAVEAGVSRRRSLNRLESGGHSPESEPGIDDNLFLNVRWMKNTMHDILGCI